jgi:hypothetical protein
VDLVRLAGKAVKVRHEFGQASDAIAAHLRLAAVGIENPHPIRRPTAAAGPIAVRHGKYHLHRPAYQHETYAPAYSTHPTYAKVFQQRMVPCPGDSR